MRKRIQISTKITLAVLLFSSIFMACKQNKQQAETQNTYMLVGSYTSPSFVDGLNVYILNENTGKLQWHSKTPIENASYIAFSSDYTKVYAVSENDTTPSSVSAYSFDPKNGELQLINTQPTNGGPCYVSLNLNHLVVGNYSSGSINVYRILNNGGLDTCSQTLHFEGQGIVPQRQDQPHVHCVYFSPDNKYLFNTDLGTDRIHQYRLNTSSDSVNFLTPIHTLKLTDGEGPRHLVFHPNGKYAYLISELAGHVIVFDYANQTLQQKQILVADTLQAAGSADIHITPNGKYLYTSHRLKGDGIAIFAIQDNGTLAKIGYQPTGKHPRNFTISKNGQFLLVAARDNNLIQVFKINEQTGLLTNTHQDVSIEKPVCLKILE